MTLVWLVFIGSAIFPIIFAASFENDYVRQVVEGNLAKTEISSENTYENNEKFSDETVNNISRVYKGDSTSRYPFMVAIVDGNNNNRLICGGSLLNDRYILTAGHCIDDIRKTRPFAWLGAYDIGSNSENGRTSIYIDQAYVHPNYRDVAAPKFDIGILRMERNVPAGSNLRSICVGTKNYDEYGVALIGWGNYDCYQNSRYLLFANGNTMKNRDCNENVDGTQICARLRNGAGQNSDQASGDSGGPLFFNSGNSYVQVGLVSYNTVLDGSKDKNGNPKNPCPNPRFPGVYTRTSQYLTYIRSIAGNINANCP